MISYNNHKFIEKEGNDDDESRKHWSIRNTKELMRIMGAHKRRLLAYDDTVCCAVRC